MKQFILTFLFGFFVAQMSYSQEISSKKNATVKTVEQKEKEENNETGNVYLISNERNQTVEQKKKEEEPLPSSQPTVVSSARKQ